MKKRDRGTVIRFTDDELVAVRAAAHAADVPMSRWIRELIRAALGKVKK